MRRFHSRRMARRSSLIPINSFKQVNYLAPITLPAATKNDTIISSGVDNYTGPSVSNNEVPTGASIKAVNVQISCVNVAAGASFIHATLQYVAATVVSLSPINYGGNNKRNIIHKHIMRACGENQNVNINLSYKIPPRFQRVREAGRWMVVMEATQATVMSIQTIYKFYR